MDLENTHTSIPIPFSIDHSLYFFLYILRRVHVDGKFMGMKNKLVDYTHTHTHHAPNNDQDPPNKAGWTMLLSGEGVDRSLYAHNNHHRLVIEQISSFHCTFR